MLGRSNSGLLPSHSTRCNLGEWEDALRASTLVPSKLRAERIAAEAAASTAARRLSTSMRRRRASPRTEGGVRQSVAEIVESAVAAARGKELVAEILRKGGVAASTTQSAAVSGRARATGALEASAVEASPNAALHAPPPSS